MKLTIEITIDNEAFNQMHGTEVARILRRLAHDIDDADIEDLHKNLFDINGNRVGKANVSK